jgi:hypothetical protein
MILEGATKTFRTLAKIFSTNSFDSYKYPGLSEEDDEKVLQYITAEYDLTITWLKFCNGMKGKSEISISVASQVIWRSIPRWYPDVKVHH